MFLGSASKEHLLPLTSHRQGLLLLRSQVSLVSLYVGDMRGVLPDLGLIADLIVADPPYGETKLAWDRWPDGWLDVAAKVSSSLWCFGSMRMFLRHGREFASAGWKLSQDVIWEKQAGSGFQDDRFVRVHETATHWYRGPWGDLHTDPPRDAYYGPDSNSRQIKRRGSPPHTGQIGTRAYELTGTRIARSVIRVRNMHRFGAIHYTQKPTGILEPLITYGCPQDGLVVDPYVGSGSTLVTARACGRRAVGVEIDEEQAEKAALWLSQPTLEVS